MQNSGSSRHLDKTQNDIFIKSDRYIFDFTDRWYNAHCDDSNGFVCRRTPGDTDPKTPIPTEVFNGYCPAGYFGLGLTGMTYGDRTLFTNQVVTRYVLLKKSFSIRYFPKLPTTQKLAFPPTTSYLLFLFKIY